MAKLTLSFETVGGDSIAIQVKDTKWAYTLGGKWYIEYIDARTGQVVSQEITETAYNAIDQLITVSAQNFGDAPVSGSFKINPHAVVLANNVGGLDQEILTADKLAFVIDTGDWAAVNDANAGTWSSAAGVANVAGAAVTANGDVSTLATSAAVVDEKVYTFSVEVGEVDLDGFEVGTDFNLNIAVGATAVNLTDADLVEGNIIEIEHTATSTANINITFTIEALDDSADQSGLTIDFVNPTFRRQTGSTQLVGVLDGTLVRYEVERPLQMLLTNGVAALAALGDGDMVTFVPTGVNGGGWAGGDLAAVSRLKLKNASEVSGGSLIVVDEMQGKLLIKTSTAVASLED